MVGVSGFALCVLAGLFVFAFGELIYVFMDIEKNTSRAIDLLARAQPMSESLAPLSEPVVAVSGGAFDPKKARRAWDNANIKDRCRMLQHVGMEHPTDDWLTMSFDEMLKAVSLHKTTRAG